MLEPINFKKWKQSVICLLTGSCVGAMFIILGMTQARNLPVLELDHLGILDHFKQCSLETVPLNSGFTRCWSEWSGIWHQYFLTVYDECCYLQAQDLRTGFGEYRHSGYILARSLSVVLLTNTLPSRWIVGKLVRTWPPNEYKFMPFVRERRIKERGNDSLEHILPNIFCQIPISSFVDYFRIGVLEYSAGFVSFLCGGIPEGFLTK